MNDADNSFIWEHKAHIENTLQMLASGISGEADKVRQIGMATLVMNLYSGIEVIIRHIFIDNNMAIPKSESWHKELLSKAEERGLISGALKTELMEYLKFRHRHTHGYGYMEDWDVVKSLASKSEETCRTFFSELRLNGYL